MIFGSDIQIELLYTLYKNKQKNYGFLHKSVVDGRHMLVV